MREGPPAAAMAKAKSSSNSLKVTNEGLQLRNNGYSVECAVCNVFVTGGKWYFEVNAQSYQAMGLGWANKKFKGSSSGIGGDANSWGFFCGSQASSQKLHNGSNTEWGRKWSQGDYIGCVLDCDRKEISYYINGDSLGVAHTGVDIGDGLTPAISLGNSVQCTVNFGKTSFQHPRSECMKLHSNLTAANIKSLNVTFEKYRKAGIQAGDDAGSKHIQPEGCTALCKDLGISADGRDFLILSWLLKTATPYEISPEEWMTGCDQLHASDINGLKKALQQKVKDVSSQEKVQKDFYSFAFDFMKDTPKAKFLAPEVATTTWGICMAGKWKLLDKWNAFVEKQKKPIRKDTWMLVLKFSKKVKPDLSNYSEDDFWPMAISEFVDEIRGVGTSSSF